MKSKKQKLERAINEREDTVCRAYLVTGNKTAAYKQGYKTENRSKQVIWNQASNFFKRPRVIEHLDKLRDEGKGGFVIAAEDKKRWLQQVIEAGLKEKVKLNDDGDEIAVGLVDSKSVISAIAELNKMDGHLAAQQLNVKAEVSQASRVKALKDKYAGKK